jgi:hypothetical protein
MEEQVNEVVYMVAKLVKTVEYTSPLTGQIMSVSLSGCEGYIPVFKTLEEANLNSANGKYAVMPIRIL